ncbi:hypothetical protein GW7_12549 [Heterocephalus glaber]|uniref:Uncharacterized protein n=1 Tax=Heterocephalus glaber TaxID=10181 RepID=G5AR67_HETGA|nr:hypothetical protein GW7_12549 [Heterocephalus glaber]
MSNNQQKLLNTYVSTCPALWLFSALIRVSAAAASSSAQLTEEVSLRRTSGSAKALPSGVDNLPIPSVCVNQGSLARVAEGPRGTAWDGHPEATPPALVPGRGGARRFSSIGRDRPAGPRSLARGRRRVRGLDSAIPQYRELSHEGGGKAGDDQRTESDRLTERCVL